MMLRGGLFPRDKAQVGCAGARSSGWHSSSDSFGQHCQRKNLHMLLNEAERRVWVAENCMGGLESPWSDTWREEVIPIIKSMRSDCPVRKG